MALARGVTTAIRRRHEHVLALLTNMMIVTVTNV